MKELHYKIGNQTIDHNNHHKVWSRRDFLTTLGLAGGLGMSLNSYAVNALASPLLAMPPGSFDDRILVLIRLKGGNDGLNMVVPIFDYGTYKAKRPSIHIKQNDLINLSTEHAIPKTMQNLLPLWNEGGMKIINSVGYDDHNLSHFTSSDIWNSANQNIESDTNKSGWLGRYLLNRQPDFLSNLPPYPGAIKISSGSSITYSNPDRIDLAVNFNTPERIIEIAEKGFLYDVNNLPDDCYYGEQVGYLRSILNVTYKYAPVISDAYKSNNNAVSYSDNELSRQLSIVARLIKGNLGTRLYMVTLEGFDTHENQNQSHPILMQSIGNAVSEFYSDLKSQNLDKKVLSVSFSEFGRRVNENQGGTDHGTAAPMMLFGPALNGNGILGKNPDLKNLNNDGNLIQDIDFRSVYASLLQNWLCLDESNVDAILGEHFERLNNLGLDCNETSISEHGLNPKQIKHHIYNTGNGNNILKYELPYASNVKIDVYAINGRHVAEIMNEHQTEGSYEVVIESYKLGLNISMMLYKIEVKGRTYAGKFIPF